MSNETKHQRPAREQSPPALVNVNQLAASLFVDLVRTQPATKHDHLAVVAFDAAEVFVAEQTKRLSRE